MSRTAQKALLLVAGLVALGAWTAVHVAVPSIVWMVVGGVLALLALGMWWAWDRTTEGHRWRWEAYGSTRRERLHARLHGAEPGEFEGDPAVMGQYEYWVAAQERAAREAAQEVAA